MAYAALEYAVDPAPWHRAAEGLGLHLEVGAGAFTWRGDHHGHELRLTVTPASAQGAWIELAIHDARLGDRLIVVPAVHAPRRGGRLMTGDLAFDREVVVYGERPHVAAPWDADTRALALRLVGRGGGVIMGGALRLLPHGAVVPADAVGGLIDDLLELAARLTDGPGTATQLERIAASDPLPTVRAVYGQLLAEATATGALGESRAEALIDQLDQASEAAFDTLVRVARDSASAHLREQALVRLLELFPLARVEPLLLTTDDTLGVRVRDALIARMHRETPPFSPLALLRLMARTPMSLAGLAAAASALGASHDPAAAARLTGLCQHRDPQVWRSALASLMGLGLPPAEVMSWLERAERGELFDAVSEIALSERPEGAGAVLTELLARSVGGPASRQRACIEALGELRYEPARELIANFVDSGASEVAAAAVAALGALDAGGEPIVPEEPAGDEAARE